MKEWNTREYVSQTFADLLIKLKEDALRKDLDLFIINSGAEGTGKSTLSLIEAFLLDSNFDFTTMYLNKYDIATRMIDKLIESIGTGKFFVHLIDEGQNVFSRRESRTKFSALTDQLIKTIRVANNVFIVNTPDLSAVDVSLQRRADVIIFIDRRGHALLWIDDEFQRKTKLVSYIEEMRRNSIYFTVQTQLDEIIQKIPPLMEFRFKKVPDEIYNEYLRYKKVYTIDFLEYVKEQMLKYLNKNEKENKTEESVYSIEEVATILNIPKRVLLDLLSIKGVRKTHFTKEEIEELKGWLNER